MKPSVLFVCWGNICRSPMGERVALKRFAEAGVEASITSAGVSDEERGNPIDSRAQRTLRDAGYTTSGHRAHQVTREEIERADLVLAFEPIHVSRMLAIAPGASNIALMTDFIPHATSDSIDDPWYGGPEGFADTLAAVEAAMPGIIAAVSGRP